MGWLAGTMHQGCTYKCAASARLPTLHACCAHHPPPQSADLEKGARQLLDQLDDLSVDVPKAPLQVRTTAGMVLLCAVGWCDEHECVRRCLHPPLRCAAKGLYMLFPSPFQPCARCLPPLPLRLARCWASWWPRVAPTSRCWRCTSAPPTQTPTRSRLVFTSRMLSTLPADCPACCVAQLPGGAPTLTSAPTHLPNPPLHHTPPLHP